MLDLADCPLGVEALAEDNRVESGRARPPGERKVTNWTDSDAINAEWSPNGKTIVFVRHWTKPREKFITYVMNADGTVSARST